MCSKLYKEGKDVTQDVKLKDHWSRYKHNYVAFPTTTHFVERSVKVSNFCSNKSRSEERTSQFALCYNLVHDVNDVTKDRMIQNKSQMGDKRYKNEDKIKARGKAKHVSIIEQVETRHNKIELALQDDDLKNAYDATYQLVKFSTENSFQMERQKSHFDQGSLLISKPRKANQTEKTTGVDFTPFMRNEVRFFYVNIKYHGGLEAELAARGFTDTSSLRNFTALKNKLKEIVAAEVGEKNIKNVKHFPILSSYDWTPLLQLN